MLALTACGEDSRGPAPSDGSTDATPGASDAGCAPDQHVIYTTPGCGATARPLCAEATSDACLAIVYYCACDGVTTIIGSCGGVSDKPYAYQGACKLDATPPTSTATATTTTTSTSTSTVADAGPLDTPPAEPLADAAAGLPDGGAPDTPLDAPWADTDPGVLDGGCAPGQHVLYTAPGCGAAARPQCVYDTKDACGMLNYYCACDGVTTKSMGGCGGISPEPYLFQGACKLDAGTDAESPCRMELSEFTCAPSWTAMLCCPAKFDGTLATVPGCDPENPDETTAAGSCGNTRVLRRVSATGGTITCSYSGTGDLAGTSALEGTSMVIPFCMISRTAVAGDDLPATCDSAGLPVIRTCSK
jgi:hypothetical protein